MAKQIKNRSNLNLFIIHFQPLERFPPVINLLNFLGTNAKEKVFVISTQNRKDNSLYTYLNKSGNIKIKRTAAIVPGSVYRVFNYLFFYLYSFYLLVKNKPVAVLYYETLSSWPALMYKKLRGDKVRLLMHCHEYTGPQSYGEGMRLAKLMHRWETKMYRKDYDWISHTNEVRLEKFKLDYFLQNVNPAIFHTMPNYPSRLWATEKTRFGHGSKIRLVYVGSLGYENMYLQETIDWVSSNREFLSLDFYAYNIDTKAKDLLNSIKDDWINYFGGCNYEDLPGILQNYDVGLVMYRPFSYNTINAVSNKVFEYLACGLDVWFSREMTYTLSFVRENTYPKIIALDFKNLNDFDFRIALNRTGLKHQPSDYYYENVYQEMYNKMRIDLPG